MFLSLRNKNYSTLPTLPVSTSFLLILPSFTSVFNYGEGGNGGSWRPLQDMDTQYETFLRIYLHSLTTIFFFYTNFPTL